MRKPSTAIALACCLAAAAGALAGPGPGDPGTVAADFALTEFPGTTIHTLSEHQGQVVMLFIIGYG